jgi:tripartite-type tricarboxylate transporter receptor subunit TctC
MEAMMLFTFSIQVFRYLWTGCMAMLVSASSVTAAEPRNYPIRPITFVVPSVAGNVNDAAARLIGQELTKTWGQAVVVENRPGAGTTTGTKYVAKSPKDGYTALLTFTAHIQNPSLFPNIGYDPIKDFETVSLIAKSSVILAVSPDSPYKTIAQLVAAVKASPGTLSYGSYGSGTTGHILGELLKRDAGMDIQHVPYKGGAPLANDLAAGHIKIGMIAVGTAMPLLQAGKIIPLAITGEKRSELLPKVPTFSESGFKGFEPDAWMGLLFPAGTPKEYSEVLSREIGRIVRLPEITTRLHGLVLEPVGNSPDEFARVLKNDMDKWSQLIQQLGIKME